MKKVTDREGETVGYEWDALNCREAVIYSDGSKVGYSYNASSQLGRVMSETGVTEYSYDPMGRIKERIMPGSIATHSGKSAKNELYSLEALLCDEYVTMIL